MEPYGYFTRFIRLPLRSSYMVRGSGDELRISGKPDYNGSLKDWDFAKIMIKSYLHQKRKWLVTQKGVAKKQFQTPAPMKAPADQTPAPMKAPATSSTGTWKILVQNADTMMSGQDGQKIFDSLEASKVLDMINNGEVDRDSLRSSASARRGSSRTSGSRSPSKKRCSSIAASGVGST